MEVHCGGLGGYGQVVQRNFRFISTDSLLAVGDVQQDKGRPVPQSTGFQLRSVRAAQADCVVLRQVLISQGV